MRSILVETVDGFQGKETDPVIFGINLLCLPDEADDNDPGVCEFIAAGGKGEEPRRFRQIAAYRTASVPEDTGEVIRFRADLVHVFMDRGIDHQAGEDGDANGFVFKKNQDFSVIL